MSSVTQHSNECSQIQNQFKRCLPTLILLKQEIWKILLLCKPGPKYDYGQRFCNLRIMNNLGPVYMKVGGPQVGEVTRLGPYNLSFYFDHVYMIGGVTCHMLPYLCGVPHLYINCQVHRVTEKSHRFIWNFIEFLAKDIIEN